MSPKAGSAPFRSSCLYWLTITRLLSICVSAQTAPPAATVQKQLERTTCPGDVPANLGSFDCSFTMSQRLEQFVAGSLTDQALLSATFFGAIAHAQHDPGAWKQDWGGLAYRVGSRYGQTVAKGLAEFTAGSIIRADPRHTTYESDPGVNQTKCASQPVNCRIHLSSRISHVFVDWLTVRQSSATGNGKRWPNLPLFAGAAASGFIGNAWYPDPQSTPGQAGIRAAYSLGTALGGSFYAEFSPEIGRFLGAIFKRGSTPKHASSTRQGGHK
jgi:hypothetical protein